MSELRERFEGGTDRQMQLFSSSLESDMKLWREDIRGSRAHVRMLGEAGILEQGDVERILEGLGAIRAELESGQWRPEAAQFDDIHMAIEARLTAIAGQSGKKLHTARSRNDQIATDIRLWLKARLGELDTALADLIGALADRAEADGRILMPGYTHLQRGQPILLGHHLLAHAWALWRDRQRLSQALERVDLCPLGAGAMAGTPHPIDRARTSSLLGFAAPMDNAMDAVSARDHLQECVADCAITMSHLSRMGEELVLWSSAEFGFVRLGDAYTTGSSIMPQKRNPDAAELVRGKAARVLGGLQTLLCLTKGLPLSYNRDLQEDREALFDAVETTLACLRITSGMWRTLAFREERFEEELKGDFSLATELADYLVQRGVPFRQAHAAVGRLVRQLEERGLTLAGLTPEMAAAADPAFGEDLREWMDPRAAAERRQSLGGTAWTEIVRQVEKLRNRI